MSEQFPLHIILVYNNKTSSSNYAVLKGALSYD